MTKNAVALRALTYMQSDAGLFRTMFQLVNEKKPNRKREDWYSQQGRGRDVTSESLASARSG